jgi:hypothetical protein
MSDKLKTLDDCYSGLDYKQFMDEHDHPPEKNGSYWQSEKDGLFAHYPNNDRTLPKETRQAINAVLVKILAAVAVVAVCVAAWIAF